MMMGTTGIVVSNQLNTEGYGAPGSEFRIFEQHYHHHHHHHDRSKYKVVNISTCR